MQKKNKIIIQGARENNLKNIDLEIPRDQFVVITGLSGSGKSSLAFDTIYAEGQRRYVESLSAYARQFLGNLEKPDVDLIEGLSPAISINQKTTSKNPRSTVATVTEIYDYLRLLYARIGEIYCPNHHEKIESSSISQIVDAIMQMPERSRIQIVAPIVKDKKGTHKKLIDKLIKDGYIRFKIDDELILGDGVQFVDEDFEKISGEYVSKITIKGKKVQKAEKNDIISIGKLPENTKYIYKNYSKEINDRIIHNIKVSKRFSAVEAELYAEKGKEMLLKFSLNNLKGERISATIKGNTITEDARKEITKEQIAEKLGELGETTFELGNVKIDYDGTSFIPFSELKNLKRECVKQLEEKLLKSYKRNGSLKKTYSFNNGEIEKEPIFSALVSNDKQEKACREAGITKIYHKQYDVAKEKNLEKTDKIKLNTNLASNLYQAVIGEKNGLKGQSLDWNLNVYNNHTLDLFSEFDNLETVFLSPELNYKQLKNIKSDKIKKGMIIYGYLKGMYIEHKIFDKDYKELKGEHYDRYKILKNDLDNIELYLDKPMNLIPKLDLIKEFNFDELRMDFTFETPEEVKKVIRSLKTKKGNYNPYSFERGVF